MKMNQTTQIKSGILTSLLISLASLQTVLGASTGDIELSWSMPTNSLKDVIAFNIYSTNNVGAAVTSWPKIVSFDPNTSTPFKTIVGTNAVFKVDQTIVPSFRAFVLSGTVSNFWGVSESFFASNTVPNLPVIEASAPFTIKKK